MPKKTTRKPSAKVTAKKRTVRVKKTIAKTVAKKRAAATKKTAPKSVAKKRTVKKVIAKVAPKKRVTKRISKPAQQFVKPIVITPIAGAKPVRRYPRFSICVYWMIIIFFVCATFYIVGRGHEILIKRGNGHRVENSARGDMLLQAGKNKLLSGDISNAIVDMTAAIKSNPKSARAYTYRGEAYMSNANYAAAKADFDKAIELQPECSLALYDRALLEIHMGGLEDAMTDLNTALDVFGKRPNEVLTARDIYSKRAQLHLWMKNWDDAISDYSTSLNQSPSDPSDEDFAGRADAFTAIGNYTEALKDYKSAITIISETIKNNENPAVRINMSRRAMSYFEKSAALNVQIKDMSAAKSDLESASTLAAALGDAETQGRIVKLLVNLPKTKNM